MHFTKSDIEQMDRVKRLKIINSVSGIKPANLIATASESGQENVAVFSSVVHLGSNPALLGFIMRPSDTVPRHTYNNIKSTRVYTINHIHKAFAKKAHFTSAKFDENESEFDTCYLTAEYNNQFKAPFVKESHFKMGMRFVQEIDIAINSTKMIIGQIEELIIHDDCWANDDIDLAMVNNVGISGLNTYYALEKIDRYPYARVHEVEDHLKK
ncbi:flavin reductase family protein [Spongiivirga citrea]|uniref:Flavin oxidoreductase n=1 Tax=Spongiivirga citrea TaxID=1481457 RepID=A0A6M0CH25_9FLAO|nr:flavin reductase [Spongiivirga citrea]NER17228.1 flavin oxidoreductase [Spongiivirga citrea]